jgi:hypothetical protein
MKAALRIGCVLLAALAGAWRPAFSEEDMTVCSTASWKIEHGEGWASYACTMPCAGPWSTCARPSSDTKGANGQPLTTLAFTADRMGGELRWNGPMLGEYKAGLATHPGGNGDTYIEDRAKPMRTLRLDLERQGLVVIDIRWQKGAKAGKVGSYGWLSRSSPQAVTLRDLTHRPALVLGWARDNLVPADKKFGTLGCSAGSLATYAAVAWHGLDSKIDYQLITGGPPVAWDPAAICTGEVAETEPKGICENDPELACMGDGQCAAGVRCALPRPAPRNARAHLDVGGLKALVDYVTGQSNVCTEGKAIAALKMSSLRETTGHVRVDHPVDFIVSTRSGTLSSPIGLIITNDTDGTITYTAGRTYSSISTTDPAGKTWNTHPGVHCSWMADPAYLADTVYGMILRGLKLPAPSRRE